MGLRVGRAARKFERPHGSHGSCARGIRWSAEPFDFTLSMIVRDREFRLRAYPLFAFPIAMLALGLFAEKSADRGLYLNLVLFSLSAYLPVILSFLSNSPYSRASWLFYSAPIASRHLLQRGVARAVLSQLLVPVYLALLGVSLWLQRPFPSAAGLLQPLVAFCVAAVLLPATVRDALPEGPFFLPTEQLQKIGNGGRLWGLVILAAVPGRPVRAVAGELQPRTPVCPRPGPFVGLAVAPAPSEPLSHPVTLEDEG